MPLQTFKSYKNDLFGDEDGDVLASEAIPAAKPIEAALPRPTTPSNRVQQQIALNQQKRLARLQVKALDLVVLALWKSWLGHLNEAALAPFCLLSASNLLYMVCCFARQQRASVAMLPVSQDCTAASIQMT